MFEATLQLVSDHLISFPSISVHLCSHFKLWTLLLSLFIGSAKYSIAYPLAELYSQSEEEILSPTEEQELQDSHTFAKRVAQQQNEQLFASQACASLIFDPPPGGDLTPSDLPAVITRSNSEESMPSAVNGPSYKAKAPKNSESSYYYI